ncbi:MAG: hypothetical protein AAF688_05930 [Bacteroidota bacterium]
MEPKFFTLKEVMLNNHCPECYSNTGLRLTFRQRFSENLFYKSITDDLKKDIYCTDCNTPIYSGRWTKDIEQVVAYQQRATKLKPKSMKIKPLAWGFIAFDVLLIALVILFVMDVIKF